MTCPATRDLMRHVLGQLAGAEATEVSAHLGGCPQCQSAVRDLGMESTHLLPPGPLDSTPQQLTAEIGLESTHFLAAGPLDMTPRKLAAAGPKSSPGVRRSVLLRPPEAADEVGRLGSYRVFHELGSGATGVVFEAEDLTVRRRVALKVMKPVERGGEEARQRFLREGRLAAALDHENILTIYEVGEDYGTPFIAMKLLKGETLDDCLKREGQLDVYESLRIAHAIAQGLGFAHARGLIHRDIKPANIWLEADTDLVKIVDFGLARALTDDVQLTKTGTVMGTPAYMAPEQARGDKVDHRCDLYALGCVIYRMVAGRTPFTAEDTMGMLLALAHEQPRPMKAFREDAPDQLQALVYRLLAKHPDARPQSAAEVSEILEGLGALLSGECEPPKPPTPVASGSPLWTVLAMALMAGGAFAAIWYWPQLQEWMK